MKLCQIILFAVLLAFMNKVNAGSSGCDVTMLIASGCQQEKICTLNNGLTTGLCCTSDNQCDVSEGDCDTDDDCPADLVCGTNNCLPEFPDTHDCCEVSTGSNCF